MNFTGPEDRPYEIIKTQECVQNCSMKDILYYICVLNNKNEKLNKKLKEDFIKDFLNQYLSGELDSTIESEKNGIIFRDGNMRFQLINYENQIVSNDNITNIYLGDCEKKLREYYHIPDDESLVIFKVEIFEEGIKMPIVNYKIYKGKGRENLDLSICEGIKIDILVPVSIDEDELYKYNITGDYYNNICFTFTSENGTDIPLKDRQKEFIKNNLTVCEENCIFEDYDRRMKKAVCNCDIKLEDTPINEINFNMESFYKYCIDIKRIANLDILKCYYILFTKEGILNNYGCFFILPIILFHIISGIIFHFRDINILRKKIREMAHFKKLFESLNVKKNKTKENNDQDAEKLKENTEKNNNENKKNFLMERQTILANDNLALTNVNKNINKENKKEEEKKEKNINVNKTVSGPIKKKVKKIKRNRMSFNALNTSSNNKIDSSYKYLQHVKKEKPFNLKQLNNIEIVTKDNETYINYNDYEMNNFSYEEALKYDKRNYFQYYLSLIRTKHLLLFVFHSTDYNSIIIKLNLFFFSFALYLTVNALFYDEETIHKIYVNNGKYDFIYQIPKIAYSSLLTTVINSIIRSLSLSELAVLKIKNEEDIKMLEKKVSKVEKCLCYKFMIFFRLSFLILIFCWYYLSCFCVVYKNTQLQLIKDTLIGFTLCLVYPLGIYLIPGIFRIPSLINPKKNRKCLYRISKNLKNNYTIK